MGKNKNSNNHRKNKNRTAKKQRGASFRGDKGSRQQNHGSNVDRQDHKQSTQNNPSEQSKTKHAPKYVYLTKNPKTSETYICGSDEKIAQGEVVVVPTRYGLDMGKVLGFIRSKMLSATVKELEAEIEPSPFIDLDIPCVACSHHENMLTQEEPTEPKKDIPVLSTVDEEIARERDELFQEALAQERQQRDDSLKSLNLIERVADAYDRDHYEENKENEKKAIEICKEKILYHKLDMKLVAAHYLLCEHKLLFFFTAENRVDFRALVKDLVMVFRMRIELRQIGVRDESRVLGGVGVCGREYCCHGVTDHLKPVSIKMAKEQNLSLNSMKISGPCGRLLCCLAYEYDFYKEEKSRLPSVGSKLNIQKEMVKISEVNILSKMFYLTTFDGRMLTIPFEKVTLNKDTGHWDVDKKYIEEVLLV